MLKSVHDQCQIKGIINIHQYLDEVFRRISGGNYIQNFILGDDNYWEVVINGLRYQVDISSDRVVAVYNSDEATILTDNGNAYIHHERTSPDIIWKIYGNYIYAKVSDMDILQQCKSMHFRDVRAWPTLLASQEYVAKHLYDAQIITNNGTTIAINGDITIVWDKYNATISGKNVICWRTIGASVYKIRHI